MFNFLRIAAAVPNTKTADIRHNAAEIIRAAREAAELSAKILVLPEAALTGADCGDLLLNRAFLDSAEAAMRKIATETHSLDMLIITCSGFIHKGRILEPSAVSLADFGGITAGVETSRAIVFVQASHIAEAGGWKKARESLAALSSINKSAYVFAGSGTSESTTRGVYGGGLLMCENGRVLAEREALSSDAPMIAADIDCDILTDAMRNDSADIPKIKFDNENNDLMRYVPKNPFFPDDKAEYPDFCNEILTIQKIALARRIEHMGAKKAVINVSGGLDSAVALLACAGAMDMQKRGRADILALFLPGFGTSARTAKSAKLLANGIGASSKEIDIKPACLQVFKDIGINEGDRSITFENVQARHRTQVALNLANLEGGLMVGTGNMSEAALGFTTFGGDALSMYNPNAGLTKTAAREVAKYAAESGMYGADVSAALRDILDTPVSPELLPPKNGETLQKTEEIVGPYELTDFFFYHFAKNGFSPKKIAFLAQNAFDGAYDRETIVKWLNSFCKRFFANQFKRISAAEGPAVLGLSLSVVGGYALPGDVSAGGAEMFEVTR